MRVKVSTLIVAGAAAVGLATALFLAFRDSPTPASAHSSESDGRAALGRKGRPVPRFHTSESAPTAEARPPAPPPSFVEPPEFVTPPKTPQEELKERSLKDGYLFQEEGSREIYIVQGGTKYHVPNPAEFEALGLKRDQVETVPRGALSHLASRPQERVLLRERNSPAVYYYENGQKRVIVSPEVFERRGFKWSDIKVVPSGVLKNETAGASMQ